MHKMYHQIFILGLWFTVIYQIFCPVTIYQPPPLLDKKTGLIICVHFPIMEKHEYDKNLSTLKIVSENCLPEFEKA